MTVTAEITIGRIEEGSAPSGPREVIREIIREYVLGFQRIIVPAKSVGTLQVESPLDFKVERLLIPDSVTRPALWETSPSQSNFMIVGFSVGGIPILNGDISAMLFGEASLGIRIQNAFCHVGQSVTLTVSNVTDSPRPFVAAVIGRLV